MTEAKLTAARVRLVAALRSSATAHDSAAAMLDAVFRHDRADWHRVAAEADRDRAEVIERAIAEGRQFSRTALTT